MTDARVNRVRLWLRRIRHAHRVNNFAHEVGMDVLQRLANGHDSVLVTINGDRHDGRFEDSQVVVSSWGDATQ